MELAIFIRTLVLGPLFSAVIFVLIGCLANYFLDSKAGLGPSEILAVFLMIITVAYLMVFIPAFGFLPGIIPLIIYSLLLTFSAGPFFYFLSKHDMTSKIKVFAITILSMIIGIVVYGGFYLLALASETAGKFDFIWVVVASTSAIFGAWTGLTYVRERPN